jgi:DNA invertase Pin-like site-specific DNA recombinase
MLPGMIDAWIYARRSATSADQASVEDQVERGHAAISEHGWNPAGVLSEEVSASRYAKRARDDWPVLLEKISAGLVGVLLLWQSSRGDRKLSEWAQFLELCAAAGTRIYVMADERAYDAANKADWKVLASQGVDNDYFSRNLSVEVARGKRKAMGKGRPASPVPYGYEVHYDPATGGTAGWRVIEAQAEVVREVVRAVGRAKPYPAIAAALNARGIPSPLGRQWTRETLQQLSANPAYAGLVRLGDGRYAERQPQKDGAEWPAIVERAEWDAVMALRASRATGPRPGAVRHLLGGVAACECGGSIRVSHDGYQCHAGDLALKHRKPLDEWVRDVLCERLSRADARDMFCRDDSPRRLLLAAELRELTERRTGFRRRAALGRITEDALQEIEDEMTPDVARLERELGALRAAVPPLAAAVGSGDVRAWWDGQGVQARREVIAAVTGITVAKVPRRATAAARQDWARRVTFDWAPQPAKRGPGGRPPAVATP